MLVSLEDLAHHQLNGERVIIVMGPTGAGKSTLIEFATRQNGLASHNLRPHTSKIQPFKIRHPKNHYPVIFVDTPGLNDTVTETSDMVTLTSISNCLSQARDANLSGIIYLHRISDKRATAATSLAENLELLTKLCGQEVLPNVVIATTMWSEVTGETAVAREDELKRDFWKGILDARCTIERFNHSYASAWEIADKILLAPQDHIIAVMGPIGSGKSTFIARATNKGNNTINDGLVCDRNLGLRTVRKDHPSGEPSITFVDTPGFDTPGFDTTTASDIENMCQITDWLRNKKLSTIVYLRSISDTRMRGSLLDDLKTFASLCGQKSMPNVVIATTMWDHVNEANGVRREEALKEDFFSEMMRRGCTVERFKNTSESTWEIIDGVLGNPNLTFSDITVPPFITNTGDRKHGLPELLLDLIRRYLVFL